MYQEGQYRPQAPESGQEQGLFPFFNGLRIDTESAAPRSQNILPLYRTVAGQNRFAGLIAFTHKRVIFMGFSPTDNHAVVVGLNTKGEARTYSPGSGTLAWRVSKDIFHADGNRMPSYELADLQSVLAQAAKNRDSNITGRDIVDYAANMLDTYSRSNEFLHDEIAVEFAQGLQRLVTNTKADFQWAFSRFGLKSTLKRFINNHPLTPREHQDTPTMGDERLLTFGSYDLLRAQARRQPTRRTVRSDGQPYDGLSIPQLITSTKPTQKLELVPAADSANQADDPQLSEADGRKAERRHKQELQIQEALGQIASQLDELRDGNRTIAGFKQRVITDTAHPDKERILRLTAPKRATGEKNPDRMTRIDIYPGDTDDEMTVKIFAGRKRLAVIHKQLQRAADGTVNTDYKIILSNRKTGVVIQENRTKARISNLLRNIEGIVKQGENKEAFGPLFNNAAGLWLL